MSELRILQSGLLAAELVATGIAKGAWDRSSMTSPYRSF